MQREKDSLEHRSTWETRRRSDWAGIRAEDAFRPNADFVVRTTARRLLFNRIKEAQRSMAEAFGRHSGRAYTPATKPQLAPCYSSFPRAAAAAAAVGMSAFVEAEKVSEFGIIFSQVGRMEDAKQKERESGGDGDGDGESLSDNGTHMLERIAKSVEIRLLAASLSRMPGLASLEFYRLFLASQVDLRFTDLPEVINAAVMFGDLLPSLRLLQIHRKTEALLSALLKASMPYYRNLYAPDLDFCLDSGVSWTRDLHRIVLEHLRAEADSRKQTPPAGKIAVAPLNRPAPPAMENDESLDVSMKFALSIPETTGQGDCDASKKGNGNPLRAERSLAFLFEAMWQAACKHEDWEDPMAEAIEKILRAHPYEAGPIEGEPVIGYECEVNLGNGEVRSGELFERVMEAGAEDDEVEELFVNSAPIASLIRRLLYPNIKETTSMERFRATGSLDPSRLACAAFSDAVYRRTLTGRSVDERGKPVLVIAADASASLNPQQAELIRLLCAGWIRSVRRSSVQLICCLYHSDSLRQTQAGRLVQWIIHPRKTFGRDTTEAIRALAGFRRGQGAQADALSIRFIVDEAQRIAAGRMVFLVLLTDADWNRSFRGKASGAEEVAMTFDGLDADYPDRLHKTVVVLGNEKHNLGNTPDAVIIVPAEELKDIDAVTRRIAGYVAAAMKERKRLMKT